MKDKDIAKLINVSQNTMVNWKKNKPKLIELIHKGINSSITTDIINGYSKEKEITNILNIIQFHNLFNYDEDYLDMEEEANITENMARFIAFLSNNKNNLNTFNSINLDFQFQLFDEIYPHKDNLKLLNELKAIKYMLPDTIVACKEYSENDFLELFENKKIVKKIEKNDINYFFIPFLIFKYTGILEKINVQMIFEKYNQFFKNNNYSDGIKMLTKDLKN